MDCSSATVAAPIRRGAPAAPLTRLPLVTLYLTERCNSRCTGCDYWRHGRQDMTLETVERLLPSLAALGTQIVLVSGGEPLMHPQWVAIARRLRDAGLRPWLLTAGLALAKHAAEVAALFETVTVSLDGTCAETYAAVRGLDAFDAVCAGIEAAAAAGAPVSLRVTVQRANYLELPRFAALARRLGARGVSFLAADIGNATAFGRAAGAPVADIALHADDLPAFAAVLDAMERDCAADFAAGLIAESPAKLRRLHDYYAALADRGDFPPVRCNAPEFSAVVEADGALRPCFFIGGNGARVDGGGDLAGALNTASMRALRGDIAAQRRTECARCVCSKWRDPAHLDDWSAGS